MFEVNKESAGQEKAMDKYKEALHNIIYEFEKKM